MHVRAFVVLMLLASVGLPATRQGLSLNGEWDCSVSAGKAAKVAVPGYLSGVDDEVAVLSRDFTVPDAMKGQRLKLRFGGVKYNSTILVNGKQVGAHFGGYEPFEADVTDAVRFGAPNQLAVRCTTWAGVMTDGPKQFSKAGGWDQIRSAPADRVLAPVGGIYNLYGIWDDVTLVSHPAVYIKDLFIKPSVRRGELVVDYTLANESAVDAEVELSAAVEGAIALPKATVKVPAGKTATATLKAPWPKPRLWSHVDPHLYVLKSQIANRQSQILDATASRLGFREFWCEGPDFYLNGSKIHMLASSGWPPHGPQTREEIATFWRGLKACGCVAFRTHTQPWPAAFYDVADELGILVVVEGAVWNDDDIYRVNDPVFWDNYAAHLAAMVARDKNHPSVVMWSLENEFTGGRVNDNTPFPKRQLIRLGKLVKQLDPTRPITYESDGDPGGVADVIGIHYPHEYPDYTCWPNEGYWLDKPSPGSGGGGIFLNGEKQFLWKRDKPLYIGEFLWIPSSDPAPHTIFFGDDAYIDYNRYRNLAKAESWKMQILAYRVQGVSGICPWTVTEGGPLDETNPLWRAHKWAYQPIAAYCLDYDTRFYSGDKVTRRVVALNDSLEASALRLNWTLSDAGKTDDWGKTYDSGSQALQLGPGEQRRLDVTFATPKVEYRQPLTWRLWLERDGKQVAGEEYRYRVFPRLSFYKPIDRVGLYDPTGATRKLFDAGGLAAAKVTTLSELRADVDILVIGAGAFPVLARQAPVIGRVASERAALDRFFARGGRVLVLEQEAYPEGLFGISPSGHSSTLTFARWTKHLVTATGPILAREQDDMRFWRGDHLVAAFETPLPATGGWSPVVSSGSAAGLDHAPVLERGVGRGRLILSQLKLVEKADVEPVAGIILNDLLVYLAGVSTDGRKTAVMGGTADYRSRLRNLGLRFDEPAAGADLSPYSLVICRGEARDAANLRRYADRGGTLLLHRFTPQALAALKKEFGWEFELQPYSGVVSKTEGDYPGAEVILREDLYWLGEHHGIEWAETPRASNMADSVLTLSLDPAKAKSYEVEEWALQGQIVERRNGEVVFATNGAATTEIDFPEVDLYVFGIVGRGTPCRGDYPIASVAVDGRTLGAVSVDSPQSCTRTTFGGVIKGRHKVTVSFVNDASDPAKGEDRNLYVDKLLIARHELKRDLVFLTTPPAVVVKCIGKGLLVIDQLRWDTEERNARKAARYASTLLAALGGDFADRPSWAIECETMTPQPDMGWFHADGSAAHFGCSGWIKTPIEVAAAGRYTMEVVAGGTPCQGVYPHVEISIDDKKAGEVQLTSGGLRPYPVAIELPEGKHELSLAFTNDLNVGGEDRNLTLDKVVFYTE